MQVDGSCHCGKISYRAEVDPEKSNICHCTDCQTLTGSPYRTSIPAAAASFRITGQPKIYIKTAASGAKRAHAFCPDCGTPVYTTVAEGTPQFYSLRIGGLRQRAELPPK